MDNKMSVVDDYGRVQRALRTRVAKELRSTSVGFLVRDHSQFRRLIADEGVTWCFGWEGPQVEALQVAVALE
jgi:hypothetical protein